ncbi:MAG: NADH-quinone oxidoreductase subunit M [Nitrospirae bacterium]|nr:NADH-quinone oxidoreductase subunit M [Nitrospirota bacterium]
MIDFPILTWITFVPLIGAALVLLIPRTREALIKWVSLVFTAIHFGLAILLLTAFNPDIGGMKLGAIHSGMQFVERVPWIPNLGISYHVGVDGLSILMVLLSSLISLIAIISSWTVSDRVKEYFFLFLTLETGMMGVFVSLDLFLFFIFWEVMLIPMYFLIGMWGGPRRKYAAIKFFLYTLIGSIFMLVCFIALYLVGGNTFDLLELMQHVPYPFYFALPVFIALFIGFAIKIPLWPFHTWLPDAHVEASTAISVILAGVLLKMGTYGILRICYPLFPDIAVMAAIPMAIMAVVNIIYGAFLALNQTDFKKLVAYSSISHMGIVLLGMATFTDHGFHGALLQMFNHGTVTAMLFLLAGVIYDRAHTRDMNLFGGLGVNMPKYNGVMAVAAFAALGIPGLSIFVGEFLSFLGAFESPIPNMLWFAVLATTGMVITTGYIVWLLQRIYYGTLNPRWAGLPDLDTREILMLTPLVLVAFFLGVYPGPALDLMSATMNGLLEMTMQPAAIQMTTLP